MSEDGARRWVYQTNDGMVLASCICWVCIGAGHDWEFSTDCYFCGASGLVCDHSSEDHEEMWREDHPQQQEQIQR